MSMTGEENGLQTRTTPNLLSANSQAQQAAIIIKTKYIVIFNFKGCSLRFYVFGSLSYIFLKKSP